MPYSLDKFTKSSPNAELLDIMIERKLEINIRTVVDSIRQSLKKGFYFGFDDIVRETGPNCWVSQSDSEFVIVPASLKRLGLKKEDLLEDA